MVCVLRVTRSVFALWLCLGEFDLSSLVIIMIVGASVSEPHIDGTAGRFHILWYDCHPRATVGRTKYVGLL